MNLTPESAFNQIRDSYINKLTPYTHIGGIGDLVNSMKAIRFNEQAPHLSLVALRDKVREPVELPIPSAFSLLQAAEVRAAKTTLLTMRKELRLDVDLDMMARAGVKFADEVKVQYFDHNFKPTEKFTVKFK